MFFIEQHKISELKGVGEKIQAQLNKLQIYSIKDLLLHFPIRYQDRTTFTPIHLLHHGKLTSIEVTIDFVKMSFGNKSILIVQASDQTGTIQIRFFNHTNQQRKLFVKGVQIKAYGEIKSDHYGFFMTHPDYTIVSPHNDEQNDEHLTAFYAATDGIKQVLFRKLIDQALLLLENNAPQELLPAPLDSTMSFVEALNQIHHPPKGTCLEQLKRRKHPAQLRLIYEELVAHHLSHKALRSERKRVQATPLSSFKSQNLIKQFKQNLPFELTCAQKKVCQDIENDLSKHWPMMRLVQGDVGSGKTLVAAIAALQAIANQTQAAFLAPTEILAEQHAINLQAWLKPLGIKITWLSSQHKGATRAHILEKIRAGHVHLIVGTHAIFQEKVIYKNLSLVIVDEQHRFGVEQRLALQKKGISNNLHPHQLTMTATPIPRTLSMVLYGDLDVSVIDVMPVGRLPIRTVAIPDTKRDEVLERIRHLIIKEQRQVYWVCTLIDTSEALSCEAAEATSDFLKQNLPDFEIACIHGKISSAQKKTIMHLYKQKKIDILVATTVIEVGVDVPNASIMVIEDPERLGLAQLHQLRGRIGRGSIQSYCILLHKLPLSAHSYQRLNALRESNDGFIIAQKDLEIRGPGEVLGLKQTGAIELKIANLLFDSSYMPQVYQYSQAVEALKPSVSEHLIHRWVGQKKIYYQS